MLITKDMYPDLLERVRKSTSNTAAELYKHIVVAGPSGSGKSRLIRTDDHSLLNTLPKIYDFSISGTTRKRRQNEIDQVDYHFLTRADFGMLDFIESNQYEGNIRLYGTLLSEVERIAISNKKRIAFDVDINGGMSLKNIFGNDLLFVYLNTPISTLQKRLEKRMHETGETLEDIKKRLLTAEREHRMIETKSVVPDLVISYDDSIRPGEAVNIILLNAKSKVAA